MWLWTRPMCNIPWESEVNVFYQMLIFMDFYIINCQRFIGFHFRLNQQLITRTDHRWSLRSFKENIYVYYTWEAYLVNLLLKLKANTTSD